MRSSLALLLGLAVTSSAAIRLTDVTADSRVTFRHTDGSSGHYYIPESVSAGLASFDYDGDGDEDLYFVNGGALRGTATVAAPRNALYRNEGHWRFTDVTAAAGVGDAGHGLGVAAADYDGDGDLDLYVSNYGPNVLYRNNGDGTFTDVAAQAGVTGSEYVGAGVCFLDADGDGDLDLFVSDYLAFTYETAPRKQIHGVSIYPGPKSHPPVPNALYRNNGDGTFTDVSVAAGLAEHRGYGMGVIAGDMDDDGDSDVVVANDTTGNYLFQNDGQGRFEEVALLSGVAYDLGGKAMGNMGVEAGDVDNDGRLDLIMTSYQNERIILYRSVGDGFFEDVTLRSGAGVGTDPEVTWGTGLVDFDNDGHRDLFVCCGHIQDHAEQCEEGIAYETPNRLYRNLGGGRFEDHSAAVGPALALRRSSRGAAFDDLDNDGDVDVVIQNSRREPTLLRNDTTGGGHWLQLRLRGPRGNTHGVGACVTVVAGGRRWVDAVHSGRGYQSHYGLRLYLGLGDVRHVDRIEVRWPGAGIEVFPGTAVDRTLTLTAGQGR